jgi:L-fucose isomerase-like protein
MGGFNMKNIPEVKLGLVAVSRNCFPASLSLSRRKAVAAACKAVGIDIFEATTVVESEPDALRALDELKAAGANALVVYLGNFGPEGPETMLAQRSGMPAMFAAAAEETGENLVGGRGDAYCGMLNASYNIGLRGMKAYIPESPVGTPEEVAVMMKEFVPVARILLGLRNLKIITFGPRPFDFLACNAPIKPLYDLGVEVQENSELDMFASFNAHAGDSRIEGVMADMAKELGEGNKMPGILPKLAQFELTLLDWAKDNLGASKYVAFANKCWPAFQTQFGFVPCYVNSRLVSRLIPAACEVDIYGALSEYIISCATEKPATLLDINNTVPYDMYNKEIKGKYGYGSGEVFMGFHCGNTPSCYLRKPELKYQLIMRRLLEPDREPDITRGTLEGDLQASEITFFRLQSTADAKLRSYIAHGEVLPTETRSFGGIGIFAIPEMARFYRHVLVEKRYPHHGGVAFEHIGRALFSAMKMLGVEEVDFNRPKGMLYSSENPF